MARRRWATLSIDVEAEGGARARRGVGAADLLSAHGGRLEDLLAAATEAARVRREVRPVRAGDVPIVFVHPVEFLVTAPDGSLLASEQHGTELDDPERRDIGTVAYFDLSLEK